MGRPTSEYLDADRFRVWVGELQKDGWSQRRIAPAAGIAERNLWQILSGRQQRVHIDVVDRLAIATGGHLDEVYPFEEVSS